MFYIVCAILLSECSVLDCECIEFSMCVLGRVYDIHTKAKLRPLSTFWSYSIYHMVSMLPISHKITPLFIVSTHDRLH